MTKTRNSETDKDIELVFWSLVLHTLLYKRFYLYCLQLISSFIISFFEWIFPLARAVRSFDRLFKGGWPGAERG
jgi:hypothetical protein